MNVLGRKRELVPSIQRDRCGAAGIRSPRKLNREEEK
jgi:hypothetical protein